MGLGGAVGIALGHVECVCVCVGQVNCVGCTEKEQREGVRTYWCVCVCVCVSVYLRICLCMCMCVCVCMYVFMYERVCIMDVFI